MKPPRSTPGDSGPSRNRVTDTPSASTCWSTIWLTWAPALKPFCQPTIRQRLALSGGLGDLDDATAARLARFAALHDIGKVNVGFQTQILTGRRLFCQTPPVCTQPLILLTLKVTPRDQRDPLIEQKCLLSPEGAEEICNRLQETLGGLRR